MTPEELAKLDEITGLSGRQSRRERLGSQIARLDTRRDKSNRSFGEKVLDVTGGKEIGQGLGQALAQRGTSRRIEETQSQQSDVQGRLIEAIRQGREQGQDTSRLESALRELGVDITATGLGAERLLNPEQLTGKQVTGDAAQLATTLASIGGVSGAGSARTIKGATVPARGLSKFGLPGLTKQAPGLFQKLAGKAVGGTGLLRGAARGAITGVTEGALSGAAFGASEALQSDGDVGKSALRGATVGGLGGLVLGGVLGGVSGGITSRQLRKQVLNGQIELGQKVAINLDNLSPTQKKAVDIAKTQGFSKEDVDFILSMNPVDKTQAQKMVELAETASVNKRAIERPIDVVGDSMVNRVKFIQEQNSRAGALVDETAKALKGNMVDASPVRDRALALLEDVGVTANADGTPNWSKSIFSKTPALQKRIEKALSDLPVGEVDAYDLHNFKKSIDEVVDYGVSGEGLKGKSANILKEIRRNADEVLDSNFADYNAANTDYKNTKEVLEKADELFGKKVGFAKERGGQLLRSVFSNNTQRPRVLSLVEELDAVAKQYGGDFQDNLLDQAIFTEILEDVYGTQATTSLQGQTERAVRGGMRLIEGLKSPVKGAGEAAAFVAKKLTGITPENRKKVIRALLK